MAHPARPRPASHRHPGAGRVGPPRRRGARPRRHPGAAARVRLPAHAGVGERSHPASRAVSPDELAERRAAELLAALEVLGIDVVPQRLGLPDSGLAGCEQRLEEALGPLAAGADLVVGTWSGDAHPDHEAVGRVCRRVAGDTPVWELPVWAWHWATPQDERFPWDRVRVVDVRDRLEAKCRAVDRFASQVLPVGPGPQDAAVLPPEVLAHFSRPYEAVLV